MHPEAMEWVARHATADPVAVLDIGGRDVNGSPRHLFPAADPYRVIDIADGPNVDVIADAAMWVPDREYDMAICTEVFEHAPYWQEILVTVLAALRPGGVFVATMAGPGRPPHSAIDGGWQLHPGEWYQNVEPDWLRAALEAAGFTEIVVDQQHSPADVRCRAVKPPAD